MRTLVRDSQSIFQAAARSVQADQLMHGVDLGAMLQGRHSVYVAGVGKAAMAMGGALERALGKRIQGGQVTVPHGYRDTLPKSQHTPEILQIIEAGHPVPDTVSVHAATSALDLARRCGPGDVLIVLISGGGSALWCAPASRIALADLQQVNRALLRSGASIQEINVIRKQLSRIKGGRLAAAAWPASTVTLIVSDVPGDDPSIIASGPTVPDSSTPEEAQAVLRRYQLWEGVPRSVRACLNAPESLQEVPAGDVRLIGSSRHALASAAARAQRLGYKPELRYNVSGEAREVGTALAQALMTETGTRCLIWGGETTVTVEGDGKGGRNHEVALAAAMVMAHSDRKVVVLSAGTDGVDGMMSAAGAWATPHTVPAALERGLDPHASLASNDSGTFFSALETSYYTGPTHTNVMDIMIALAA